MSEATSSAASLPAWKSALLWIGVSLVAIVVLFIASILAIPATVLWMVYRIITGPFRLARGWLRPSTRPTRV